MNESRDMIGHWTPQVDLKETDSAHFARDDHKPCL